MHSISQFPPTVGAPTPQYPTILAQLVDADGDIYDTRGIHPDDLPALNAAAQAATAGELHWQVRPVIHLETAVILRRPVDESDAWQVRGSAFQADHWQLHYYEDAAAVEAAVRSRRQVQDGIKFLPSVRMYYGPAYGCCACGVTAHFYEPTPTGVKAIPCGYCHGQGWVR